MCTIIKPINLLSGSVFPLVCDFVTIQYSFFPFHLLQIDWLVNLLWFQDFLSHKASKLTLSTFDFLYMTA